MIQENSSTKFFVLYVEQCDLRGWQALSGMQQKLNQSYQNKQLL